MLIKPLNMKKYILLTLLLSNITILFGQTIESNNNLIDNKLKQCLEADSIKTDSDMVNCTQIAINEWDKELNRNYKLLMSILPDGDKEKLKASQLKWIEYRDLELEFSRRIHHKLEGTMWLVVETGRKLEIIKQRAIELNDYYELLSSYKL